MTREIGNSFVLPVEMFNNTDSFSFLKWMRCGGQWLFLFQEMYSLVHMRVCPLLNSEGPCLSATCASWESSFKLFLTWQSSVYMADLDLSKSCLHWWCLDVTVCFLQWELLDLTLFCALETWVETWPGLCPGKLRACVWMSELRCLGSELRWSSLGKMLFSERVPWPSQGSVLR